MPEQALTRAINAANAGRTNEAIGIYRDVLDATIAHPGPMGPTVVGQTLGIGDGTTKTFPFVRTYGLGNFTGTEPVGGLDQTEPLNVYLNDELQSFGYSIDTATPCGNFITFTAPPAAGVDVTASFSFRYFAGQERKRRNFRVCPRTYGRRSG